MRSAAPLFPGLLCALLLSPVAQAADPAKGGDKGGLDSMLPKPELTGFVQMWITAWDQDVDPLADPASYGDPEDDPGFKIRRARMGIQGEGAKVRYDIDFGYSAPFDAVSAPDQGPIIQVVDASGGYRPVKGLWIDGGVMKVPVGREFLMSTANMAFSDRSLVSQWLVPGRDVGLQVDGTLGDKDKALGRMRVGVFNGNGSLAGNDAPGLLYAGRVEGKVGPGDTYKTFGKVDGFTLGVAGDFYYNDDLATNTLGLGGDLMMRVAGLALMVEVNHATLTPDDTTLNLPAVLAETPRTGVVAQLGYSVWRVEPAVRVAWFDDNANIDDNGDVLEVMGGATIHGPKDTARAGLGYINRTELGGRSFANDSVRLWMQFTL